MSVEGEPVTDKKKVGENKPRSFRDRLENLPKDRLERDDGEVSEVMDRSDKFWKNQDGHNILLE